MKSENVTHRLQAFIRSKNLAVSVFEKECGIGASVLAKAIKYNSEFSFAVFIKILDKYPNLNMDWVITGRGSMLISGEGVAAAPAPAAVTLTSGCDEWKYKYYQLLEKYNECLENRVGIMAKAVIKDVM